MTDNYLLLFAVIAIVVFALLALPRSGRAKRQRACPESNSFGRLPCNGNYRVVSIKRGTCAATRYTTGRKFTFDVATILPVAGCKALRCFCSCPVLPERRKKSAAQGH